MLSPLSGTCSNLDRALQGTLPVESIAGRRYFQAGAPRRRLHPRTLGGAEVLLLVAEYLNQLTWYLLC